MRPIFPAAAARLRPFVTSPSACLPAKLQSLICEADSATKALRSHLKAVMLDLGPVARHAADDESGVLSKSDLLKLVDRADTIFSARAALVLPQGYNASLSTAASEHGEPPLQQLNQVSCRLLLTSPLPDVCLLRTCSCRFAIPSSTVAMRRRKRRTQGLWRRTRSFGSKASRCTRQ